MPRRSNPMGRWAVAALCATGVACTGGASAEPETPPPGAAARTEETAKMPTSTFKKPPVDVLRERLTPEQFRVTQHEGTEQPFRNAYWNHHDAGIYVDVVSGEPLFSSRDKFDSGTGWPSFTRPLDPSPIATRTDRGLLFERTEVRSKLADSHLGHVFDDGPAPTGLRYCINSAALRFVPVARLAAEGYGHLLPLFEEGEPPRASR